MESRSESCRMALLRHVLSKTGAGAPFQQVVAKTEGVAEGGASIFEPTKDSERPGARAGKVSLATFFSYSLESSPAVRR